MRLWDAQRTCEDELLDAYAERDAALERAREAERDRRHLLALMRTFVSWAEANPQAHVELTVLPDIIIEARALLARVNGPADSG